MNRIDKKFKELKAQRKKALIIYITAGDPSLAITSRLVLGLERAGADIIELGIPFSDPMADGPTIQAASQRALKNKVTLDKVFKMVGSLRNKTDIPLVFMTYYNPVLKYGPERFFKSCRINSVDGVIVPDLPFEEAADLINMARRYNVAAINLVAPTSTAARIKKIVKASSGFIYYVSLTGVTGARGGLPQEIGAKVRLVKSMTNKPVCVGFGVSNREQAAKMAKIADGVIVGSAVINKIEKNLGRKKLEGIVATFTRTLNKGVKNI